MKQARRNHFRRAEGVDKVDTLSQKCKHFFEDNSLVHALTVSGGSPPVKQVAPTLPMYHGYIGLTLRHLPV